MENYCSAQQATDDNMAHAHCMLDTKGYKHTLRLCKTRSFSTATMSARTLLSINVVRPLTVVFIRKTFHLLLIVFMYCGYTILPPPAMHFADTDCAAICGGPYRG